MKSEKFIVPPLHEWWEENAPHDIENRLSTADIRQWTCITLVDCNRSSGCKGCGVYELYEYMFPQNELTLTDGDVALYLFMISMTLGIAQSHLYGEVMPDTSLFFPEINSEVPTNGRCCQAIFNCEKVEICDSCIAGYSVPLEVAGTQVGIKYRLEKPEEKDLLYVWIKSNNEDAHSEESQTLRNYMKKFFANLASGEK